MVAFESLIYRYCKYVDNHNFIITGECVIMCYTVVRWLYLLKL